MNEPLLLKTRLIPPQPRSQGVKRVHLLNSMNGSAWPEALWISGAPGAGKTNLAVEWLSTRQEKAAWIGLSEEHRRASLLLKYLSEGLKNIGISLGQEWQIPFEARSHKENQMYFIHDLINQIVMEEDSVILILDDFHYLKDSSSAELVQQLLEHCPNNLKLVFTSRSAVPSSFLKQKSKGRLLEITMDDLRFSLEESLYFLKHTLNLPITRREAEQLHGLTEGWAGGLQLAAMGKFHEKLQSKSSTEWRVEGTDIGSYLMEETLQVMEESSGTFLHVCALLGEFNGPLCDWVLESPEGVSAQTLHRLAMENFFVQSLESQEGWFRFHGLFRRLILQHFSTVDAHHIYQRAAQWFHKNGMGEYAIDFAIKAESHELTTEYLIDLWPSMEQIFQTEQWLHWAETLPIQRLTANTDLVIPMAWATLNQGDLAESRSWIAKAKVHLQGNRGSREQRLELLSCQAYLATVERQWQDSENYAQEMLSMAAPENQMFLAQGYSYKAIAQWKRGELEQAFHAFLQFRDTMDHLGIKAFAQSCYRALVEIRMEEGRFTEADRLLREVLQQTDMEDQVAASLHLQRARLFHCRGHFDLRDKELEICRAKTNDQCLVDYPSDWQRFQAEVFLDQGDFQAALEAIYKAEELHVRTPSVFSSTLEELHAEILILQGNSKEAEQWIQPMSKAKETLVFHREPSLRLYCLMDRGIKPNQELLTELLKLAQKEKRILSQITLLISKMHGLNSSEEKSRCLSEALELSQTEAVMGPFLRYRKFTQTLLLEGFQENSWAMKIQGVMELSDSVSPSDSKLLEKLSSREKEVLGLVAQGLSNQQIADQLFVSLSTIKGHNLRIFEKLQVKRRTEAVALARRLHLI